MSHIVYCVKLKKRAAGLAAPPYINELGERIYSNISQEAWNMWLSHQTLLINENRLSMLDVEARKYLVKEMEKFLFGDKTSFPDGYVPENLNSEV